MSVKRAYRNLDCSHAGNKGRHFPLHSTQGHSTLRRRVEWSEAEGTEPSLI